MAVKRIVIKIDKNAILREVARRAYILGESSTEDERVRYLLQSATDMGHKDLIERAMSDAVEMIAQAASPYMVHDGNVAGVPEEMLLDVVEPCLPGLASRLERSVRIVLEDACSARWLELVKQDASSEVARMVRSVGDIRVMLNSRMGVLRQDLD